jgi:hypothetical protein
MLCSQKRYVKDHSERLCWAFNSYVNIINVTKVNAIQPDAVLFNLANHEA